ncbi:MAG: hypothetical protein MJ073_06075, partial [Oscillibacter sp.]|nr:hypothetical protein [Oscillibacter sp.]
NGKYEDAVWRKIENQKAELHKQVKHTKKAAPLDLDACTGLTEEQRDAHTAELDKLHRAADCKLIADTLVNELLGDEKSFQKMSKFVTVSRETLERPIRYGHGMENLLNESPDAPRQYAKMAKEHPDQLVKKYQEHVAAAQKQQAKPAKSAQPVKAMQPAQPQMQVPANH